MVPNPETDFKISRGDLEAGTKRSYKGILYTNTFMVDQPITLLGVSFFGPHEKYDKEAATYKTTVSLQESLVYYTNRTSGCKILQEPSVTTNVVKKGEKFRVNFPQMVILKSNLWYDILFELSGPDTGHMKLCKVKTQYTLKVEDKHIVKFDSFVGSCQMPDFHFLLA